MDDLNRRMAGLGGDPAAPSGLAQLDERVSALRGPAPPGYAELQLRFASLVGAPPPAATPSPSTATVPLGSAYVPGATPVTYAPSVPPGAHALGDEDLLFQELWEASQLAARPGTLAPPAVPPVMPAQPQGGYVPLGSAVVPGLPVAATPQATPHVGPAGHAAKSEEDELFEELYGEFMLQKGRGGGGGAAALGDDDGSHGVADFVRAAFEETKLTPLPAGYVPQRRIEDGVPVPIPIPKDPAEKKRAKAAKAAKLKQRRQRGKWDYDSDSEEDDSEGSSSEEEDSDDDY